MQAVEYIHGKGWEFKRQAGELILRECPFCHDTKYHFYITPGEGLYFCHKCNERGNLLTLKKAMGDTENIIRPAFKKPKYKRSHQNQAERYHEALLRDQKALEYLQGRVEVPKHPLRPVYVPALVLLPQYLTELQCCRHGFTPLLRVHASPCACRLSSWHPSFWHPCSLPRGAPCGPERVSSHPRCSLPVSCASPSPQRAS